MSHTNSTTNYSLPQFLGTDKPAWLGDINPAMSAIDTQMKANADGVTGAQSDATTANTNIGTLANLTTTSKTTLVGAINEVDEHADTAQDTANTASSNASSALSKATAVESALNLVASSPVTSGFTTVSGVNPNVTEGKVTVAKNSDGSLCKVYGYLNLGNVSNDGTTTIKLVTDSGLRPEAEFEVEGCCLTSTANGTGAGKLIFKTSGEIDVTFYKHTSSEDVRLIACVIFVKNFGD